MRRLLCAFLIATGLASGLVAQTREPAPGRGLRVEVSVPPSVRKEAITGRVYVMIAKTNDREPRLQIGRTGTPVSSSAMEPVRPLSAPVRERAVCSPRICDPMERCGN